MVGTTPGICRRYERYITIEEFREYIKNKKENTITKDTKVERRNRIDDFMKNHWVPKFMENFTKESAVMEQLNAVKNEAEKSQIIQEFTEAANNRIEERRTALVDALYDNRISFNTCTHANS